ncbi:glycoside hydrolase family 43 protein [Maribellus sp. YY47]|uniref:glycoside hydrolase family 43 protein n=1 Tax=Maribellus sp. YY47 TaxID=2929486 RepID=UPI002000B09A|nr:glycoside hydrolase family 43 protein [Maribellus sp. YY47]MCK3684402.1 glycoside hydrolase family 43 protein [Maribellus sp. YY47]
MKAKSIRTLLVDFSPFFFLLLFLSSGCQTQEPVKKYNHSFKPGEIWVDSDSVHINAHGGGILIVNDTYYWFGEHKTEGKRGNSAQVGVQCYSSKDLYNWKNEGVALAVSEDPNSDIVKGCVLERPKVIYNAVNQKFVMYFHLELKGKGYSAARVGIAVSDEVTGPYNFIRSLRPNAGQWPVDMTVEQRTSTVALADFPEWWTEEWMKAVHDGLFIRRDFEGGQMSRDMTLYVDDDGKAYHIFASEENLTLHIAELTDDYLDYTGKYIRVAPGGHNEAPAIFKKDGVYYMITSGCTGWAPNAARLHTAESIWGPWTEHPNPCVGDDSDLTFHSQSTYILPVSGKNNAFIFMADRWNPSNAIDGRYVWLPIQFENGLPVLKWLDEWTLDVFDDLKN